MSEALCVGFAQVDSTPELGTYLGGYARLRASSSIRDRLRAQALAFDAGSDGGAIVIALDLVFIHHRVTERIRAEVTAATGVPSEAVLISCSHAHSTPYGNPGDRGARHHRLYVDRLIAACVRAATDAWHERQPGTLTLVRGTSEINVNRRMVKANGLVDFGWNEVGSQDHELQVLELRRGGRAVCAAVCFPCHPIVLPPSSRAISADWVGEFRRTLEGEVGVPIVFLQGGCADINPRHEWDSHNDRACRSLGVRFAADVRAALAQGERSPIDAGPIAGRRGAPELALEPEHVGGAPLPYWRGVFRDRPMTKWAADLLRWRCFPWETRVRQSDDGVWLIPLEIQCLRIGGLAIAAHGAESFHQTGIEIRGRAPQRDTLFLGYANDMIGYVPRADAIPLRGYEVDTVPYLYALPGRFAPSAEPTAVAATLALLDA